MGGWSVWRTGRRWLASLLSGEGWIPPGLHGLEYSSPLALQGSVLFTWSGMVTLSSTRGLISPPGLVGEQWQVISCSFVASTESSLLRVMVEALSGAALPDVLDAGTHRAGQGIP